MTYLLRNYCTFQRVSRFSRLVLESYSTKPIMPRFLKTKVSLDYMVNIPRYYFIFTGGVRCRFERSW